MNTTDIWSIASAVLLSVGGASAILFGMASWLAKVWASRILENEKTALQIQFAQEKSKIDRALHVHNVAASRIDTQRVEAVLAINNAIADWHEAVIAIVHPNDDEATPIGELEKYQKIARALQEKSTALGQASMRNCLYFSKETYFLLAECGETIDEMSLDFYESTRLFASERLPERLRKAVEKITAEYEDKYTPARVALLDKFRELVDPITGPKDLQSTTRAPT